MTGFSAEWWQNVMMLPLRLMPCCFWLRLCGNVRAPPTFQQAISQFSHTRRHMGRPEACVCLGKAKSCWKRLHTCDSGDLFCADFSLYSTCSQDWGSRSEVVFHCSALALACIPTNCIYCRLNQIWAETLHSKEGIPHWNRSSMSRYRQQGH